MYILDACKGCGDLASTLKPAIQRAAAEAQGLAAQEVSRHEVGLSKKGQSDRVAGCQGWMEPLLRATRFASSALELSGSGRWDTGGRQPELWDLPEPAGAGADWHGGSRLGAWQREPTRRAPGWGLCQHAHAPWGAGRARDHGSARPPLLTPAGKMLPLGALGLGCCDSLKGQPAPAPGASCAAKPRHQEA